MAGHAPSAPPGVQTGVPARALGGRFAACAGAAGHAPLAAGAPTAGALGETALPPPGWAGATLDACAPPWEGGGALPGTRGHGGGTPAAFSPHGAPAVGLAPAGPLLSMRRHVCAASCVWAPGPCGPRELAGARSPPSPAAPSQCAYQHRSPRRQVPVFAMDLQGWSRLSVLLPGAPVASAFLLVPRSAGLSAAPPARRGSGGFRPRCPGTRSARTRSPVGPSGASVLAPSARPARLRLLGGLRSRHRRCGRPLALCWRGPTASGTARKRAGAR